MTKCQAVSKNAKGGGNNPLGFGVGNGTSPPVRFSSARGLAAGKPRVYRLEPGCRVSRPPHGGRDVSRHGRAF